MTFTVEFEREDDGRWLAEVLELPGVLATTKPGLVTVPGKPGEDMAVGTLNNILKQAGLKP